MVNATPSNSADAYWGSISCDVMGGAIMSTYTATIINKKAAIKIQSNSLLSKWSLIKSDHLLKVVT